jgi:hypothetical protein
LLTGNASNTHEERYAFSGGAEGQLLDISSIQEFKGIAESINEESDTLFIRIGCGIVGSYSPEILTFRRLDSLKDYASIKERLYRGSNIDKLIATIVLNVYSERKEIILSESERNQIMAIRSLKTRFYVCSGCTIHIDDTIDNMFLQMNGEFALLFSAYHIIKESIVDYTNSR